MSIGRHDETVNSDGKEPEIGAARRYLLGEFELEPGARRLRKRDGTVSHLANRPFRVLLHLIAHRERLVARSELLDLFWDGREVYDDSLTRCVSSMRKALSDQGDPPRYVETRWAEGYRYIGPFEEAPPAPRAARGASAAVTSSVEPAASAQSIEATAATIAPQPDATVRAVAALRAACRAGLHRWQPVAMGTALLAVFALCVLAVPASWQPMPAQGSVSLAVIPIDNLGGESASEHFDEGLTDSLISMLSEVRGIDVVSRSSVSALRDAHLVPQDLGRRLGVTYLLEGAVSKEGDTARVSLRLVKAAEGTVVWVGDSPEYQVSRELAAQDAMARELVNALRYRLGKLEGAAPRGFRATRDAEAYRAYLEGRFLWNRRDAASMQHAIERFQRALDRDPAYAAAHAGLADALVLAQCFGLAGYADAFPRAREAAREALRLDESLAEAHAALAVIKEQYEFDWPGAEREFRRALELNPGYATAHQWYGELLLYTGRFDEASAHLSRARVLDPLSPIVVTMLGSPFLLKRDYAAARDHYLRVLEQHPGFAVALLMLGQAYQGLNQHERAIDAYRKAWPSLGSNLVLPPLIHAHVQSGRDAEALRLLAEFTAPGNDFVSSPYKLAVAYAAVGDSHRALELLERAYAARDNRLVMLAVDAHLDSLRDDPRFVALSGKVGLPARIPGSAGRIARAERAPGPEPGAPAEQERNLRTADSAG